MLLKGKVYTNKSRTIDDLKESIHHETAAIPAADMLQCVYVNLEHCVQKANIFSTLCDRMQFRYD
jgi:hypothetical protein